jgi:hypothetical protein
LTTAEVEAERNSERNGVAGRAVAGSLTPEDHKAIAAELFEHLKPWLFSAEPHNSPNGQLVDAAAIARDLGVSTAYIYEHADELGARRGPGKKPRLRFDLAEARAAFRKRDNGSVLPTGNKPAKPRRRKPTGTNVELLPFRGRED